VRIAGYAPYLDYRPLSAAEQQVIATIWPMAEPADPAEQRGAAGAAFQLPSVDVAERYAITVLAPRHCAEVRACTEETIRKIMAAVHERLSKEIIYWDERAVELQQQEEAGKTPRLNSARARQRRDELEARLRLRKEELEQARHISPAPPRVISAALIIPAGLLARLQGGRSADPAIFARETQRVEQLAMAAVMAAEQKLGFAPRDVSAEHCGYDIESAIPGKSLRFIEVKGRIRGAQSVTVTKNEILTALNKPDDWLLALVEVPPATFPAGDAFATGVAETRQAYSTSADCRVRYVRRPFKREPDFGATSVNYQWAELWAQGEERGMRSEE
jgi:hypothetical protein